MTKTVPLVVGIEPKERDARGLLLRHGLEIAREINLPGVILGVAWFITAIFGGAFLLDHLMTNHGSSLAPFLPVLIGVWITTFFFVKMLLGYLLGFLFRPEQEQETSTLVHIVQVTFDHHTHSLANQAAGMCYRGKFTLGRPTVKASTPDPAEYPTAGTNDWFLKEFHSPF